MIMKRFLIVAFSLAAAFACTKPAEKQENPEDPAEFMSITVQETGPSSATVVFVPGDNEELYAFGVVTKDEFDSSFMPSDVDVNDNSVCRKSVYSHTFEGLQPETAYMVYAYAVDEAGKYVEDRIASAEFTTQEQPEEPVDPTFGVTVDNLTPGKVDVHIDTKDYGGTYFYGYITKAEYEACADDNEVFSKIIDKLMALNVSLIENGGWSEEDVLGAVLKTGSMDMSLSYLRPDTEYAMCVFGCNASRALLTDVSVVLFRVPSQDMVEDVSFTVTDVNVTVTAQTLATVQYTVKADNGYDGLFFVCSLDKSVCEANSRTYTGEVLPIEEYCWYDYFDMFNYYLDYVDLNWIFENAVWQNQITYEENKGREAQDKIMYVYALAVDGQYCMPRQSKASVHEITIPGYENEL